MKKKLLLTVLLISFFLGLIGLVSCGKEKDIVLDEPGTDNPFDEKTSKEILGQQSHGFMEPLDAFEYITYSGQEVEIDYFVELEGISLNVGFLLYINGEPQPYKIKERTENYAYLHSFNVANGRDEFTFQFDVTSGQKDEIMDLAIVSIYNPEFKPDMKETTSYNMYHSALPTVVDRLKLEIDPSQQNVNLCAYETGVKSLQNESLNISEAFWNTEVMKNFNMKIEDLDNRSIAFIRFNGVEKFGSVMLSESESLNIEYYMAGVPEAEYVTTFYIDHKPIDSIEHKLTKGNVNKFELSLNISDLEDLNTFYVISVPKHEKKYMDKLVLIDKTSSYMLYKESIVIDNKEAVVGKSTDFENYKFIGIEEEITAIEYANTNHLIIHTDSHLYLYDLNDERVKQKVPMDYQNIREKQSKILSDGYALIIMEKSDNGSRFKCLFYDDNFEYKSELVINDLIDNEMLVSIYNIAISDSGDKIAIATMSSVHLYDVVTGKIKKIVSLNDAHYENRLGVATIGEMHFTKNDNRLLFLATSFTLPVKVENKTHMTYGYLNLEGAFLENKMVEGYMIQDLMIYDHYALLTEFEINSKGQILVLDLERKKEMLYDTESLGDLGKSFFGSDDGAYFSAVELNAKEGYVEICIYRVDDGSLVTSKRVSDVDKSITSVKVYINDGLRLCFVVLGSYDTLNKFHF